MGSNRKIIAWQLQLMILLLVCLAGISGWSKACGQVVSHTDPRGGLACVEGRLVDGDGNVLSNVTITLMDVTTGGIVDTLISDKEGYFRTPVPPGLYTIGGTLCNTWSSIDIDLPQRIGVSAGDSVFTLVNMIHGRGLVLDEVRIDNGPPRLSCTPGTSFTLSFAYHIWAPFALLTGDEHISVGIDGALLGVEEIGTPGPFPGVTGQATFQLTAPDEPGLHTLYILQSSITQTTPRAMADYYLEKWTRFLNPEWLIKPLFIPVGTIEVLAPAGAIEGSIEGDFWSPGSTVVVTCVPSDSGSAARSFLIGDNARYQISLETGDYFIRAESAHSLHTSILEIPRSVHVGPDHPAHLDLDFTDCTFLEFRDFSLTDSPGGAALPPETLVEYTCAYDLTVSSQQQTEKHYVVLGINETPHDVLTICQPGEARKLSDAGTIRLFTPPEAGVYQVYAKLVSGSSTRDALEAYRTGFREAPSCYFSLGSITVRQ